MRFDTGDVVVVDFPGATGVKRRPAVVVSGTRYHAERPDVVLGVLTTNTAAATTSLDHLLQDWQAAGLRAPSAFRCYFTMAIPGNVRKIGRLSQRDIEAVRVRIRQAFE